MSGREVPAVPAAELAREFGLELRGNGDIPIRGIATLASARPDQLSFLANPAYRKQLASSRAGAVVLGSKDAEVVDSNRCLLISTNPYADFARMAARFTLEAVDEPGIHPSAVVATSARISPGAPSEPTRSSANGAASRRARASGRAA